MSGPVSFTNLNAAASSEINMMLQADAEAQRARRNMRVCMDEALAVAGDLVTNRFPSAILPRLSDAERAFVISNVCIAAEIRECDIKQE